MCAFFLRNALQKERKKEDEVSFSQLMVSLRALREQQYKEARCSRIIEARRVGSQLGKESAQRYASQKKEQDDYVKGRLEVSWRQEIAQKDSFLQHIVEQGHARQGEGMRSAALRTAQAAARSEQEIAAWDAEHQLEQERYAVAVQRDRLLREAENISKEDWKIRRDNVRKAEHERSLSMVSAAKANSINRSALSISRSTQSQAAHHSVSLHSAAADEPAELKAQRYTERRLEIAEWKKQKALQEQRKASERAVRVVEEMKQEEERRRLEAEHEELLRQSMAENAMRSALRPVAATDFQEQESRHAQRKLKSAEQEFESTFLRGPWETDVIRRTHQGFDDNAASVLEVTTVESLRSGGVSIVRLVAAPLDVYDVDVEKEAHDVADDDQEANLTVIELDNDPQQVPHHPLHMEVEDPLAPVDLNVTTEADVMPQPPESIPSPTPRERSATPPTQVTVPPIRSSAASSETIASGTTSLRHRHEQFLRDLEALQQRLHNVTSGSSMTTPRGGESRPAAEEDAASPSCSVSSMSFSDTDSMRARDGEHDSITTTSDDVTGRHGLTAQQLQSVALKFKRNQAR